MRFLFAFTALLLCFPFDSEAQGQEWAPLHAVFYFAGYDSLTNEPIEDFYMAAKDTLLDGTPCRAIVKSIFDINDTPVFFTYTRNDSVFIRGLDSDDDTFYLWMDFSAQPGDTLTLGAPVRSWFPAETYRVVVDNIETIVVGETESPFQFNITTRRFNLQPLDGYTFFPENRYVEVLGSTENLIPYPPELAPFIHTEFNCYNGSSYAVSITEDPVCFAFFDKTDDLLATSAAIFSPNPFRDRLTVELAESLDSPRFIVFDATGKAVRSGALRSPQTELDLSGLPAGAYGFRIATKDRIGYWKLIKIP